MSQLSRRSRTRKGQGKSPRVRASARAAAHHRQADAGPDHVVCLLCGGTYRAINYMHLKRIHGFEGEHPVRDYKQMFGLRVAACEETCSLQKAVQVRRHEKAGRHWTPAKILRAIRRRKDIEHGLAYSRAPVDLTLAARREFGSWDDALRAAGVDPSLHRLTNAWDRDRLVQAIRRYAKGGRVVTASWIRDVDPTVHRAALRLLGNWSSALRAAGLDPKVHREPKRWPMERVVTWVRETHAAGGDIRSSATPPGALARVRLEREVPWSRFVESLGVAYPGPVPRHDWTQAAVLAEIRKRQRGGQPLYVGAMTGKALRIYQQGAKLFGSWDEALRAAGLDPLEVRRHRAWTRDEVLDAIRARQREGKSLAYREAVADDSKLVLAATRMFPTSWTRAVIAAGFDAGLASRDGVARAKRRARHK